jgi:hypothetical protein
MSTTATVTSVTGSAVTVSWTSGGSGVTSYDIVVYKSASSPVATSSTYVGTYSNKTSPATLSITTTGNYYYAATVIANYNSSISGSSQILVSIVHQFTGIFAYSWGSILENNTSENTINGTLTTGDCGGSIQIGGNTTITGTSGSIHITYTSSASFSGAVIFFYTGSNNTGSYSIVYGLTNNNDITIPVGTQSYYLQIDVGGNNYTTYGFNLQLTI